MCCTSTSERNPGPTTDSGITDDDIVFRYDGETVGGITILPASIEERPDR